MGPNDDQQSFDFGTPESAARQPAKVITRKHRGYQIYLQGGVTNISKNLWRVLSQHVAGALYTVMYVLGRMTCNCKDFQERVEPCKHIFAVEFFQAVEPKDGRLDNVIPIRTQARDWRQYNATKAHLEYHVALLLQSITRAIDDPPPQPGHQPASLRDLVFACIMRSYIGESGRDFFGDLQERWVKSGFLARSYHFNTLSSFLRKPIAGLVFKELIRETAAPLESLTHSRSLAVDSSGFATANSSLWYDVKYEKVRKRNFLKLHIACDTVTHIVTDAIVTDDSGADRPQLIPLLEGTLLRYRPDEVSADRIYASRENYDAIANAGAIPYLPPRARMTGKGSDLMRRMFHAFRIEDPAVLSAYHKRSNVETVMYMIKVQFGDAVMARSVTGATNELLSKVLCHNLACLATAVAKFKLEAKFFESAS